MLDAGLPDIAMNSVFGDALGLAMVKDPRVDFVSFKGSIPVGKLIELRRE